MPRLNWVFEELGIHHEEHKVPSKVLKSMKEKAKKPTAKNATMVAESKKWKGAGRPKTVSKKPKAIPPSGVTSVAASVAADEEVAENVGEGSPPLLLLRRLRW
jgi:hypothetical protein